MLTTNLKNKISELISDGIIVFYDLQSKNFIIYDEQENSYYEFFTGDMCEINKKSIIELPKIDIKQEALNFIYDNKNLYFNEFSRLKRKYDAQEAAFKLLVSIDNNTYSNDFELFVNARLEKANKLLSKWIKDNSWLIKF